MSRWGWARAVAVVCALPATAGAQQGGDSVRAHEALVTADGAPSVTWERARGSAALTLRQRISLELRQATVRAAVVQITGRAGIRVELSPDVLSSPRTVSLHVANMTVGEALQEVLDGSGFEAYVSLTGEAVLVRRATGANVVTARQRQGGTTIVGRVTDAKSGAPITAASVLVQGSSRGAVTGGDGRYTIRFVAAGAYTLVARYLGYQSQSRVVTVPDTGAVTVDFALLQSATVLDEVVTTGAGLQRRVELGNAIATINADSVVRTAPVTNLTDVLSGRAPNVDVVQTNGMVGSGPAIRIRGRGSLTLSNDPIYIVDGVRIDGAPGGQVDAIGGAFTTNPTASRLNDLDPDEIETIEVLRGPSAATEYGTDAANGVVVITTKRGHAGSPRWSATAEEGVSTMPAHFPDNYYSWGHTTDATHAATPCPLVPYTLNGPPGTPGSTAGTCVVDSVTRWQPLNHSETSLFGTGTRGHYELQVAGGGTETQYFLGGGLTNELGALRLPPVEVPLLEHERGQAVPRDQLRPNALTDESVRGRVSTGTGGIADLSASAAYINNAQRSPDEVFLLANALDGPGIRDSLGGYAGPFVFDGPISPASLFAITGSEGVSRFTGGLSGTWRPWGWLSTRSTVGLDDARKTDELLELPGQGEGVCNSPSCTVFGQLGYRSVGLYGTDLYTIDLGATASAALTQAVSAKTAVGLQYNDRRTHGSVAAATNLALGNPTLNGGTLYNQLEQRDEATTLGSYVEETIGFTDRLFLVGAVRVDAGSGFGTSYKAATYPKASASWVVLPEGGKTSLRLRAAYGQSGVQPPPGSALQLYTPAQAFLPGGPAPGAQLATVGSPGLKPERTREVESGFDLGLFGQRVTAEVTGYSKLSHDALVSLPLAASAGAAVGAQLINVGSVRNEGIETSITARVLDGRAMQWDVTVSGSDNENRLVTLGPGVSPIDQTAGIAPYKQQPGYPLYGYWAYRIHYADANHDGIIEPNEVQQDATASFIGPSLAPRELSLNTGMTLFSGRVHVGGQLDHRGGQYRVNFPAKFSDAVQYSRATNDRTAPLARQAQAVALLNDPLFHTSAGYVESAAFTRLRELSLTYFAPSRLAAAIRARTVSVTVAGRNLALWTKYTGSDPEVNTAAGSNTVLSPGGVPTTALNPDIVSDYFSVPQMRYWTLKVNVGL